MGQLFVDLVHIQRSNDSLVMYEKLSFVQNDLVWSVLV